MQTYQTRDPRQVERTFRPHARRIASRLRARARVLAANARRTGSGKDGREPGHWHKSRAKSLDKTLADVAAGCEKSTAIVACNCTAKAVAAQCGRYKFCQTCLTARRRRTHARMSRSLDAALERYQGADVYLCTITTWHSGDIAEDLRFLKRAVPDFIEASRAFGALGPYVYVYELTNGEDGLGHVHAHIALLARWMDYHGSADQWRRVSARHGREGTEERKLQVPNYRRDPRTGDTRRKSGEVSSYLASHSLPSYLSKAEESEGLDDDKLGDWIGATYGKRLVITSKGFWVDSDGAVCKCCKGKRYFAAFTSSPARVARLLEDAMMAGLAVQVPLGMHGLPPDDWPPGELQNAETDCNTGTH